MTTTEACYRCGGFRKETSWAHAFRMWLCASCRELLTDRTLRGEDLGLCARGPLPPEAAG